MLVATSGNCLSTQENSVICTESVFVFSMTPWIRSGYWETEGPHMAKRNHVLPYNEAEIGTLWLKRISRHMSNKYEYKG